MEVIDRRKQIKLNLERSGQQNNAPLVLLVSKTSLEFSSEVLKSKDELVDRTYSPG